MAYLGPPRYILLSNTGSSSSSSFNPSSLLGGTPFAHPTAIHYQYLDDPPINLLSHGAENDSDAILVMDVMDDANPPVVRSVSMGSDVVVTGVRVTSVPGATTMAGGAMEDDAMMSANPNMYVIDLAGREQQRAPLEENEAFDQAFLHRFRQQNDYLRKILDYDSAPEQQLSPLPEPLSAAAISSASVDLISPPPEPESSP